MVKRDKKHKETELQKQTFEVYYDMGDDRSLEKCHELVTTLLSRNFTLRTIKNWSIFYHWQDRIEERKRRIAEAEEKERQKLIEEEAKRRINTARKMVSVSQLATNATGILLQWFNEQLNIITQMHKENNQPVSMETIKEAALVLNRIMKQPDAASLAKIGTEIENLELGLPTERLEHIIEDWTDKMRKAMSQSEEEIARSLLPTVEDG